MNVWGDAGAALLRAASFPKANNVLIHEAVPMVRWGHGA